MWRCLKSHRNLVTSFISILKTRKMTVSSSNSHLWSRRDNRGVGLLCGRESNMWGGRGGRPVPAIGGLLCSSLWPGSRDLIDWKAVEWLPWYSEWLHGHPPTLLSVTLIFLILKLELLQIVSRYLQLIQSVHTTSVFNSMVTIYCEYFI